MCVCVEKREICVFYHKKGGKILVKILGKEIDLARFFAYNRNVGKLRGTMQNTTKTIWLWVLRIFLTLACVATLAFILSNSLKEAQESAAQSSAVVEMVQEVASIIAPESAIANATGEDYEILHAWVRAIAHLSQFALLGALMIWCYFSYTNEKLFLSIPLCLLAIIPVADEFIQSFVGGRASSAFDMLLDTAGGVIGVVFAALTLLIGRAFVIANEKKKEECTDEFGLEIPEGYPRR